MAPRGQNLGTLSGSHLARHTVECRLPSGMLGPTAVSQVWHPYHPQDIALLTHNRYSTRGAGEEARYSQVQAKKQELARASTPPRLATHPLSEAARLLSVARGRVVALEGGACA